MNARLLIVNADDFGYSEGINRGIIDAHLRGIVTSTSVMIDQTQGGEVKLLSQLPLLSIGLHFQVPNKTLESSLRSGRTLDESDIRFLEEELRRQMQRFRELLQRRPTHFDSHHNVHYHHQLMEIFRAHAGPDSPIRGAGGFRPITTFYAGRESSPSHSLSKIGVDALLFSLSELSDGLNELICHPGYIDEPLSHKSSYARSRQFELETLQDRRVLDFIRMSGIQLVNWSRANTIDGSVRSRITP